MTKIYKLSSFLVAGVLALGAAKAQADSITAVSWGGAYTKSQLKAYHEPFEKKFGIKVNSMDYNGGLAEIQTQVQSGNVTWDVVDVELADAIKGCDEGLFERIDHSILPAAPDGTSAKDDFLPGTLTECGVGQIVWSQIIAFDPGQFSGKKPSSMKDFFDTKNFPGKRGIRKNPKVNLEWALIADGVAPGEVYKTLGTAAGVDRAFKKLDTIKSDLIFWEAGAQPPQMLADKEVSMVSAYNGRIFNAQVTENKPFVIIWDGQVWDLDLWAIPKGSKNLKNTLKFVAFSTDTQRNADQAKYISYGPVRKSSAPLVSKHAETGVEMKPHMPTNPKNFKTALQNNFVFWADNFDEINERFNAWMAK